MTELEQLAFYVTDAHDCSYLPGEHSSTLFVDPTAELDQNAYSQLSNLGFRRSGKHVYRPHCEQCQKCIPIRVPTSSFVPNKSQLRCLRKNQDLQLSLTTSIAGDEYYGLYERYIRLRHNDGDMFPPTKEQYSNFLTSEWGVTQYLVVRDTSKKLLAVAVMDRLTNGVSAIYTFFEPDEEKRSLGVFCVLSQIRWAQQNDIPFVFLGYWIKECRKMVYKTNYSPYQLFINNQWVTVKS